MPVIPARGAEAGGSPRVQGQPGLHSQFKASLNYRVRLFQNNLKKKINK